MEQQHLSEVVGDQILPTKSSIWAYIEQRVSANFDGPAAIVMHQPADYLAIIVDDQATSLGNDQVARSTKASSCDDDNGSRKCLSWSYRQLCTASTRSANALLSAGIQSESATIVGLLPNGMEFPLMVWTSVLMRVTMCNLDPGCLQSARHAELDGFLRTIRPEVIIIPGLDDAIAIDRIISRSSLPEPRVRIVVHASNERNLENPQWTTLSNFVMRGAAVVVKTQAMLFAEAKQDNPDRTAYILFTSGTSTGTPKGVKRSVRSAAYTLSHQTWTAPGGQNNRTMIHFTNFRISIYVFSFQAWNAGGAIVMSSAVFDPDAAISAIRDHRINSLMLIPYQAHSIIDHPRFETIDARVVEQVGTGGDIITMDLMMKLREAFPNAHTIRTGHGMTEGGGIFVWPYAQNVTDLPYFGRITPLGKVGPGARLRIIDKSTGEVTPRGVPGELHISCSGYVMGCLSGIRQEDFY